MKAVQAEAPPRSGADLALILGPCDDHHCGYDPVRGRPEPRWEPMTSTLFHALGLHMHQPPGNLRLLIEANPWEAEQIIRCYERPVRYAARYRDVARLHVGFSGGLLDQLLDQRVVDLYRHILDIPAMLDGYAQADNIELIGMGQHHPIFPLIPREDWPEQLELGRLTMQRAFGRMPRGFWPPELAFTMEMIPALVEAGFDYVVADGIHVLPEDGISDVFRPYLACHNGVCITVVPRDRDVSAAQHTGLDATWFQNEVRWRTGGSPRPHEPRLVTTWSDGENGNWFREPHEGSGFFGYFFAPYMEHYRGGEYPINPVSLSAYLEQHPPQAHAQVQTGSWNVGTGFVPDLSQWAGSAQQKAAVEEVTRLSARYWDLHTRLHATRRVHHCWEALERARRLLLEAETSCYFVWGDSWIPLLHERTVSAFKDLDTVAASLEAALSPAVVAKGPPEPERIVPPPQSVQAVTELPPEQPLELPGELPPELPGEQPLELPGDPPPELPGERPSERPSGPPGELLLEQSPVRPPDPEESPLSGGPSAMAVTSVAGARSAGPREVAGTTSPFEAAGDQMDTLPDTATLVTGQGSPPAGVHPSGGRPAPKRTPGR